MRRLTFEQQCNLRDWIKALRSGEFKQTTGAMHRLAPLSTGVGEGFCCLGVGAYNQGVPKSSGGPVHVETFEFAIAIPNKYANVPPAQWVMETYGLSANVMGTLLNMNDSGGRSFAEIADYLESFLVGYEDGDDDFEVEGDEFDVEDNKASETYFD